MPKLCDTVSICYPEAKNYILKINEYSTNWRMILLRILEEGQYKNGKDLVDQIRKSCPVLFENYDHEEFAKKLDEYVLIEKLYGNCKDSVIDYIKKYCSNLQL